MKAIEGLITKTSLKQFRPNRRYYKWAGYGVIIKNVGPTNIYLLIKIINTAIRIGVSNLNNKNVRATLAKFGKE